MKELEFLDSSHILVSMHVQRSLPGYGPQGHTESDITEVT